MACSTEKGIQAACSNPLRFLCHCARLPRLPSGVTLTMRWLLQENRVATLQSLSGTGSLRVAAEFIAKFLPGKTAYLSNPTWGNHKVCTACRLDLLVPHALDTTLALHAQLLIKAHQTHAD